MRSVSWPYVPRLHLPGLGFAAAAYALYLGIGVVSDTGAWITAECVAAVGAIPGFIGLAYLVLWLAKRNSVQP